MLFIKLPRHSTITKKYKFKKQASNQAKKTVNLYFFFQQKSIQYSVFQQINNN